MQIDQLLEECGVASNVRERVDLEGDEKVIWMLDRKEDEFIFVDVGVDRDERFEVIERVRIGRSDRSVAIYNPSDDEWRTIE